MVEDLVADQQEGIARQGVPQLRIIFERIVFGGDSPVLCKQVAGQLHRRERMGIEEYAVRLFDWLVAQEHHRPHGAGGSDAVLGHYLRIRQRRHGCGRHQCDVGFVFGEILCTEGRRRQQQFGTEVTFVLDTIDERYRIEIRHGRYTWNYDHHP